MKKIIGLFLLLPILYMGSCYALDGRIETKQSVSAGGSPYVPIPVGMAINEKGLPGEKNSCPKGCWRNRWVNDCRCATSTHRILNVPGSSPVLSCFTTDEVLSYYEKDIEESQVKGSKEDVYVWKVTTKKSGANENSSGAFSIGEPGIQILMTPTELAKDRNPNSVKCPCGTDVRGKDQGACDRICDFLKNNTNKTVCPNPPKPEIKSPRDNASGQASGKRSASNTGTIGPDMEPDVDLITLDGVGPCRPPYLCLEVSLQRKKGWDGTIKGSTKIDELTVNERELSSGLPTGKRQHSPVVLRASTNDMSCDGSDNDCDGKIVLEADLDGDGYREELLPSITAKEKPKTGSGANNGEGKKEYVGHVSLLK